MADGGPRSRYPRLSWPVEVAPSLEWYVYALRDPRDGAVFYIGKGVNDRIFSHVRAVLAGQQAPDKDEALAIRRAKAARINAIHDAGRAVEHLMLRDSLPEEDSAYIVEQSVIDAYRATGHPLTNLAAGHHSAIHGLNRAEDVVAIRGALPAPALPTPCLLFKLNKSWYPGISERELYDATRGNWGVAERSRNDARVAFGMYGEVILSAFRIDSWASAVTPEEEDLWCFEGTADPSLQHYVGRHVRDVVEPGRKNFRVVR